MKEQVLKTIITDILAGSRRSCAGNYVWRRAILVVYRDEVAIEWAKDDGKGGAESTGVCGVSYPIGGSLARTLARILFAGDFVPDEADSASRGSKRTPTHSQLLRRAIELRRREQELNCADQSIVRVGDLSEQFNGIKVVLVPRPSQKPQG